MDINNSISLSYDIVKYILKPIYDSSKNIFNYKMKFMNIEETNYEFQKIINNFYNNTTKLHNYFLQLNNIEDLIDNYIKYKNISKHTSDYDNLIKIINIFENSKIFFKISLKKIKYYDLPEEIILITPLGISLMIIYTKYYKKNKKTIPFRLILEEAHNLLSKNYTDILQKRLNKNLKNFGKILNENEICFIIFLLICQAIEKSRGIVLNKPIEDDIKIAFSYISKYLFNKDVFENISDLERWIQRSTAYNSIKPKLYSKYNIIIKKNLCIIFLDLKNKDLYGIVLQIIDNLTEFEKKYKKDIKTKLITLIEQYSVDRSLIFEKKPEIYDKILSKKPSTQYLTQLAHIFKEKVSAPKNL